MHVGFIFIFIPQFLMDGLIGVLLFNMGHFGVSFGVLGSIVCHDSWNILLVEGIRFLGGDLRLKYIAVCCTQILSQFLHRPVKLVWGSWSKIEDVAFQVTTPTLEVGIRFCLMTLDIAQYLIVPIPYCIVQLFLDFLSWSLWLIPFRRYGWFILYHPLQPFQYSYV